MASTVGGLIHGVAKEVTIVPAFSCFKLACAPDASGEIRYSCGSTADITANLECAPSALAPCFLQRTNLNYCACHRPRATAPPSQPRSHRRSPAPTAAPPLLLQVGAYRLRSTPQSALRSDLGSHRVGIRRATRGSLHPGLWLRGSTRAPEKRPRKSLVPRRRVCTSPSANYESAGRAALAHGRLPHPRRRAAQRERVQHVRRS